jgi:hypothetical protein
MKPFRKMTCCCCGGNAGKWHQHWNRDTGFGICVSCVEYMRKRGTAESEILDLYGTENMNWGRIQPWPST